MDSRLRKAFNASFGESVYTDLVHDLERRLECKFGFRLAETPVFLPVDFRRKLEIAATEVVRQLCEPSRIQKMERDLPQRYNTPRRTNLPGVAIVDFAVTRDARGALEPKVVELQGFPSLFALTAFHANAWGSVCGKMNGMPREWTSFFSGLDENKYFNLLKKSILGAHEPENVILMDLDPAKQKTSSDFHATEKATGVEAVCPTTLARDGRKLYRMRNGKKTEVRRIYHRVVFDELEKSGTKIPFCYDEDLDVEWFPHPAWYFLWSKSSMPHLDHPSVPKTYRLSEMASIPRDLSRFVLKPFHSFAGGGVNVDPTEKDIYQIRSSDRAEWCLQEKVDYAPVIEAVDGGGVKVEIRTMFLRPDDAPDFTLATNLCRLSRGKMLGVDFNKNFTWVGGSVAIWPK
ncbi:MAG: hypothetical protein HY286_16120 [Planctomycetes bacterium]|nr:hypothetical protein [Planctomycetota bacterium]